MGNREREGTGNREGGKGNRERGTGNREWGTGNGKEQGTGNGEQEQEQEQEQGKVGEQSNLFEFYVLYIGLLFDF
jgi:hypothetical protein